MKFFNRVKTFASTFIVAKIQIKKNSKTDNTFLCEGLTKDGSFIREYQEGFSYGEIKKVLDFFESKMKKCAWLTFTGYNETVETDMMLLINPELMEKERVGFELYGPISDRSANTDLKAYYSFNDEKPDFRQELSNDTIFGFFRLSNFESSGGFKATLNELGVTYVRIENTVTNYMFLSMNEFKRQFKKDEVIEPKKKFKKEDEYSKELKEIFDAIKKFEESKPTEAEKSEEVIETPKRGRGRPAKTQEEKTEPEVKEEVQVTEQPVKRGRGRPPKERG